MDAQFLYICYREGNDSNFSDDWSIILVIAKAQFTSPGAIVPNAILRVDQGMVLELAVDYAIDPNAPPGIFAVSRGLSTPNVGYESLRVATVSLVGGVWTYTPNNYALGNSTYVGLCAHFNGGEYHTGQTCDVTEDDVNFTSGHFFSACVRPDFNGVRKIWAVHSVQPTGLPCDNPGVLQWYEIPASNPGSFVATRYTLPDGDSATDASMAVNDNGDLVIYFTRSYADPSKYPGIWRLTKPRGQAASISEEKAGPPVVYQGRNYGQDSPDIGWADYTGTEPDPVDRCQFWSHHMTAFATPGDPCGTVTEKWQSYLLRTRLSCDAFALRGNLDMNQDGVLTGDDVAIYQGLAADGDPDVDRTYEGQTDEWDFLDFMQEWNDPG